MRRSPAVHFSSLHPGRSASPNRACERSRLERCGCGSCIRLKASCGMGLSEGSMCIKNASERSESGRFDQYWPGTRHRENPYYIGLSSSHTEKPGSQVGTSNPAGARIPLILQGFLGLSGGPPSNIRMNIGAAFRTGKRTRGTIAQSEKGSLMQRLYIRLFR